MSRSRYNDPLLSVFDFPFYYRGGPRGQPGDGHPSQPDNFYGSTFVRTPAVELTEEGREYVVEAELPGVRKEDLEVRVGEGGKSLTIEGKVLKRGWKAPQQATGGEKAKGTEVAKSGAQTEEESPYSAIFSRTFTLPRPVDGSRVKAKLEHGVLVLHIPQMEERGSMKVNID